MTRIWSATDTTEPVTDTMMEQFGNAATYNVINGCAPSYSGANLDVTVAAGTITHNGISVAVAGSSVTLVADGSQPRWSWVALNSAGSAVLVSGTPAANPTVPELGDYVEVALVYVEAGQPLASACAYKLDKRMYGPRLAPATSGASVAALVADVPNTNVSTHTEIPSLALSLAANTTYVFRALIHYTALLTTGVEYQCRFIGPSGTYLDATVTNFNAGAVGQVIQVGSYYSPIILIEAKAFGTGIPGVISVECSLITGATAGQLKFHHRCNGATLAKTRIELS